MRIVVLHSEIGDDAPPDEQDTIATAHAVSLALGERGHMARLATFDIDELVLKSSVADADVVFNLVESVWGDGFLAAIAPARLEKLAVQYTGSRAACLALAADKVLSKHILRAAGLPTADWSEPPDWRGLTPDTHYIVKSITEDASLGLDDGAVVTGSEVAQRAQQSAARHGGRWFAEEYLEGREFNVAVLETPSAPRVLPIAEMRFEDWAPGRPQIVGYQAKWEDASDDARKTVRRFGIEKAEPALAERLTELALRTWQLFGMRGYARIDFRLEERGAAMILEANPNPALAPDAGFAAAGAAAGFVYADLLEHLVRSAVWDRGRSRPSPIEDR